MNIFSGIQPSGILTIGHYISVLSQWKNLQNNNNCIFCIADLHSMINFNFNINNNVFDILSIILSIGINFDKNIIFLQSDINEHLKLFWILSCFSKYNKIKNMHKFKNNIKTNINLGLISYPTLMASDILLYDTDIVPIGIDQNQNVEFIKNLSIKFNKFFNTNFFKIPKESYINNASCIKSLLKPNKKMSKSDKNINNYISMLDNENLIINKINKSITDSNFPPVIKYDIKNKPGISNLLIIASQISNISINDLENNFKNKNYNEFKKFISNILIKELKPIKNNYSNFRKNENFLKKILFNGYKKAKKIAVKKIYEINKLIKSY